METIGGFYCCEPIEGNNTHFFDKLCPLEGQLFYFMSGRCANYYALKDISITDTKKTAYVPAYTCETVLAPFKKAGYELIFYEIRKDMTPVFEESVLDQISVINLCGYYGFCNYDRKFIKKCSEKGITIIEDITHSVFSSDGIDPLCDYIVGSMRKWIGVLSGGFAIKTKGHFSSKSIAENHTHLLLREKAMKLREIAPNDEKKIEAAYQMFWDAEMMLREIFDAHRSDDKSIAILKTYDYDTLKKKRRENYQYLADHLKLGKGLEAVFPKLTKEAVPSHFSFYTKDREKIQNYLRKNRILSSVYWPKDPDLNLDDFPDSAYIYDHILSVPCDQRYNSSHMEYICSILNSMLE